MKNMPLILGATALTFCINTMAMKPESEVALTKSASVAFASLDTSIDSDKTDSITATILKGKYKGAKLHGELTHIQGNTKQYQLIFTSMRLKQNAKPLKITAYGIDADTARTALTIKVNDEYFNRHGKVLSSSFLQSNSESSNISARSKANLSSKVKIISGTDIGVLFVSKLG